MNLRQYTCSTQSINATPASGILKPLWRLICRSSPVLLNDKVLQHTRVLATHGCPSRPEVWLHPIIRQVLWRYRSSLYRSHRLALGCWQSILVVLVTQRNRTSLCKWPGPPRAATGPGVDAQKSVDPPPPSRKLI